MPFITKLMSALFGRGNGIDRSGQWWKSARPEVIQKYLASYMADGYPMHEFRLVRCGCGSQRFGLDADDCEGVARRTCAECGEVRFICDSEQYAEDAEFEHCACVECGGDIHNIGVGFSTPGDGKWVRWLDVGVRCDDCGTLGCFAGWDGGGELFAELENKV